MEFLMENKRSELERWASMMRDEVKEEKTQTIREMVLSEINKGKNNKQIIDLLKRKHRIGWNRAYEMVKELRKTV
jgi:hypothetical protein